jgi:hypothetical protein
MEIYYHLSPLILILDAPVQSANLNPPNGYATSTYKGEI